MNKDIRDVLCAARGDSIALATVTHTEGSAYRRPGARMLIGQSERLAGSVSGGCLERDLVRRAAWLTEDGPRLLRFETSADADETELHYTGCGGTIEILLERVDAASSPLDLLAWIADQNRHAVLATVVASDLPALEIGTRCARTEEAHRGHEHLLELCDGQLLEALAMQKSMQTTLRIDDKTVRLFIESVPPVKRLLVAGRHHDVAPVINMARMLGWETTVAAGAAAAALGDPDFVIAPTENAVTAWAEANPGGAAVVMTHSLALDRTLLGALLSRSCLPYLGLLGPKHRTADILGELAKQGIEPHAGRLRSPIGLPLGGDGPEAVALSIIAEVQQHFERLAKPKLASVEAVS